MTTERIVVEITETGARKVRREIEEIGSSSRRAASGVDFLKRSLVSLGSFLSARALLGYLDTLGNVENRLRLLTKTTTELRDVQATLFKIANDTRSEYETTAILYSRTAQAVQRFGLEQSTALAFTKALNQATIISGASVKEAHAALIQLTQGLQSGRLAGDELKAVLEQLPIVADVIAKQMGVTREEIKQLGTDGKINSEIIIAAFLNAGKELEEKFAKTIPTIGQSFVILKNNFLLFLQTVNQSLGISTKFSSLILLIANNIDRLAQLVLFGATSWVIYRTALLAAFAASVLSSIVRATQLFIAQAAVMLTLNGRMGLFNLLLAGPSGSLVVGLSLVVGGLLVFNQDFRNFFITVLVEGFIIMDKFIEKLQDLSVALTDVLAQNAASQASFLSDLFGFGPIQTSKLLGEKTKTENTGLTTLTPDQIRGQRDLLINQLSKSFSSGTGGLQIPLDFTVPTGFNLEPEGKDGKGKKDKIKKLKDNDLKELNAVLERQKDLLREIKSPLVDYQNSLFDLATLVQQGAISQDEFNRALDESSLRFLEERPKTTFLEGYRDQLGIMYLETKNAVAKMGQEFATIFGPSGTLHTGISNAIGDSIAFGNSFKEQIGQISRQILSQLISALAKMALQLLYNIALAALLRALLGAFGGGIGGAAAGTSGIGALAAGAGGLAGFASGGFTGNAGTGQIAGVVHGQEFVVNSLATRRNRAALEAMNAGKDPSLGTNSLEVSIRNEIPNASYEVQQLDEGRVEIIARRIVQQESPKVIAKDLNDPNSRTSKAVSNNTNAQRRRP